MIKATLAFCGYVGIPLIVGFLAGYRGKWFHQLLALGAIVGLFLLPLVAITLRFERPRHMWNDSAAFTIVIGWVVVLGSFVGSMLAKKKPMRTTIALHAGFLVAAFLMVDLVKRLVEAI